MAETRLSRGLIQVYTGDGRGKTTCALGLALRAVGQGLKVFMVQFMKGRETGEVKAAAARLAPEMTLRPFGRPGLVNLRGPAPEDLALVREAWDLARQVIAAGAHDLVILDEINLALTFNLLPMEEVFPVGRTNVELAVQWVFHPVLEVEDPRVLQESPEDGDHPNALAHPLDARLQTAEPADNQVDGHAGPRGVVEGLLWIRL